MTWVPSVGSPGGIRLHMRTKIPVIPSPEDGLMLLNIHEAILYSRVQHARPHAPFIYRLKGRQRRYPMKRSIYMHSH